MRHPAELIMGDVIWSDHGTLVSRMLYNIKTATALVMMRRRKNDEQLRQQGKDIQPTRFSMGDNVYV